MASIKKFFSKKKSSNIEEADSLYSQARLAERFVELGIHEVKAIDSSFVRVVVMLSPNKFKAYTMKNSELQQWILAGKNPSDIPDEIFGTIPEKPLVKEIMKGFQTATNEDKHSRVEKTLKKRREYHMHFNRDEANRKLNELSMMHGASGSRQCMTYTCTMGHSFMVTPSLPQPLRNSQGAY